MNNKFSNIMSLTAILPFRLSPKPIRSSKGIGDLLAEHRLNCVDIYISKIISLILLIILSSNISYTQTSSGFQNYKVINVSTNYPLDQYPQQHNPQSSEIDIIALPSEDTLNSSPESFITTEIEEDSSADFLSLDNYRWANTQRYTITGEAPRLITKIRPVTALTIGGVAAVSIIALHINQQNAWWKDQRGGFHFTEDWVSALQVDKMGHAFGGYLMAYGFDEALKASGVDYKSSALFGSALAVAYQSYVEIEDGFAGQWGFSPSDFYFNSIGSVFYLAQHYVPALQNITPKWQYVPSEWTGKPIIDRPRTFIDDYNSSTFWYSLNLYNVLSKQMKKYWVPWLDIAFGYGADAIDAKVEGGGTNYAISKRRYVVAVDYNLVHLLPEGGSFWNWFRQSLNYIKLPSPAVEFSPSGTRFYMLYPFQINLGGLKF